MSADARSEPSCTVVCRNPQAAAWPASRHDTPALAARLVEEMAAAWRNQSPLRAEELFLRHPELCDEPEVAIRLIYEEVCLRREGGEEVHAAEVLARFPQWREPLARLLERRWRLDPGDRRPPPPAPLAGYRVLAELGHGAEGRVYLATQPALGDQPVVLKVTPRAGAEHLPLARLQHTHIVPLQGVHNDPDNHRRILCMPYFGGATWEQLLGALGDIPAAERSGDRLVEALDRVQRTGPLAAPGDGPARQRLAALAHPQAVAWVGMCLGEALAYAHERGLVHLDVKPSNVLLAADGTPMLLDFHTAQGPLQAGARPPAWLGGTPGYMAPEQARAVAEAEQGRPIPQAVDGRADVYALGVLLYESLAGTRPGSAAVPLRRYNRQVSVGLADIIHKCLAEDAGARYPDAASLAADLRRHLADLPLRGVRNRSWSERWGKWRRRQGPALPLLGLMAAVLGMLVSAILLSLTQASANRRDAEATLAERWPVPGEPRLARRAREAENLHRVVEELRAYSVLEAPRLAAYALEARCRAAWKRRDLLLDHAGARLEPETGGRLREDLLDLAVCWADLRARLASPGQARARHREALDILGEAERRLGPDPVLERARAGHLLALGREEEAAEALRRAERSRPQNARDHWALGRWLLRRGETERARGVLERAVALEPAGLWPNFYLGVCAARLVRHGGADNEGATVNAGN